MSPATTTEAAHAPNFHDHATVLRPLWRGPSVLARGWRAPALVGREAVLTQLETVRTQPCGLTGPFVPRTIQRS